MQKLQQIPLYFSAPYEGKQARAEYHPSAEWLAKNDCDPGMAKRVEFTNPMEYFAENTEAFFSKNDFYTSTREELLRHDPAMGNLLIRLWGVQAPASP